MPFTGCCRARKRNPSRISLFRKAVGFSWAVLASENLGSLAAFPGIGRLARSAGSLSLFLLGRHHDILSIEQEGLAHSRLAPLAPISPPFETAFVIGFLPAEDLARTKQVTIGCAEAMCDHRQQSTPHSLKDNMGVVGRTNMQIGMSCAGPRDDRRQG